MHFALSQIVTLTLPPLLVLAQRHHGGGDGGGANRTGGDFRGGNAGGSAVATTFVTMTFTSTITAATSTETVSAGGNGVATVDGASCPTFNITANIKANDGTANCVGDNGALIPCDCPPSLNIFTPFLATVVQAGSAFPAGNSIADQLTRLDTCTVALQNFRGGLGSGNGCPIVATKWKELRTMLQSGG
ncbi:hypothetical protein PV08_07140 [Exophiala spinifera]|uniref:Uncharacterized protein n=1 Tax=Exophiala spinifera TaxID=91928 RepID=A0A0D2B632_9EURO|nr:uncharacterized protein PV08_07140 [Exophiala spinifera]KIW14358.1 hypothetical protein PV08_07140 [Exophiala spinifera]